MSWEDQALPVRDPRLEGLLRAAEGDSDLGEADRSTLHARIAASADLPLARLRGGSAGSAAGVAGGAPRRAALLALAPLAVAAGIATMLWTGLDSREDDPVERPDLAEISTLEEAFVADLSEQEFRAFVSGSTNSDELLLLAAGEG